MLSTQTDVSSSTTSVSLLEDVLVPAGTAVLSASFGLPFAIFVAIMVCVGACFRGWMAAINAYKEVRIHEANAYTRIYETNARIHEADARKAEAEAQKAQAEAQKAQAEARS